MTVAAFMDLALYDSEAGYYARAVRRSGRAGDFFTSVDVGPIFGELLAAQLIEMADILKSEVGSLKSEGIATSDFRPQTSDFDLVEAGAGNGRLSADILRAARRDHPQLYDHARLHLVEASPVARAAQRAALGDVVDRLASGSEALPQAFEGALVANELLDAMPVHQVVMRADGLREVYVDTVRDARVHDASTTSASGDGVSRETRNDGALVTLEGPPSTPALAAYLERLGVELEPGWRAEINLRAVDWVRTAARALRRGFLILIDYGHDAQELYSATHAGGTLTTFARHTMSGPESAGGGPAWLRHPGEQDITAHVDFTSVRAAAEAEGLQTLGFLDQTYFLLGLLSSANPANPANLSDRLAIKTLLMPGGLGSTHKVLILSKGVGTPSLRGCSFRVRIT